MANTVTKVTAKVAFYYNGDIDDFLSLVDMYDGNAHGIFCNESNLITVKVKKIKQFKNTTLEDIEKIEDIEDGTEIYLGQ